MPDNNELSERELEILQLVATGASNKEVANQLYISTNTVKVHLKNIYSKIDVTSRTEATMWAVRNGLVQPFADDAENASGLSSAAAGYFSEEIQQTQPWWRSPTFYFGVLALLSVFAVLIYLLVWQPRQERLVVAEIAASQSLDRWQFEQNLPEARSNLALVSFEDSLFAIGGETEQGVSSATTRYDPETSTWIALAAKPQPVADANAALIGGKIYVPGGRIPSGEATDTLEVYDPRENRWTQGARLPKALSAYGLATWEGKLYVFGGWDGGQFVNDALVYDPAEDVWADLSPMATARGYCGATSMGGEIYILGGLDEAGNILQTVEVYNPLDEGSSTGAWSKGNPLPEPRYAMGVVSILENLYLFGGKDGQDTELAPLVYSAIDDAWQELMVPFSHSWSDMGMSVLQGKLYIAGGKIDEALTDQLLEYQAIYSINIPLILPGQE